MGVEDGLARLTHHHGVVRVELTHARAHILELVELEQVFGTVLLLNTCSERVAQNLLLGHS